MTEKLFYCDSHMTSFSATVLSVSQMEDNYEVVLDRTAFFPTGGGQYADTGMLGNVRVVDVNERDGIIYHKTDGPLTVGDEVVGEIDWEERFSKMQQHSGEHIVSGIVHATYGYDNVGFHMGKDAITMDFNGELDAAQLREIEWKANQALVKNLDIVQKFPTEEELSHMEYRSKIEIEGQVRIVEIPGYDSCACCAPHVKKTGEIGIIRLLGVQRYKSGVRVSMLCGFRALMDIQEKADSVRKISNLLSAKEELVADEVERLKRELADKKQKITTLEKENLDHKADAFPKGAKCLCHFEESLEGDGARFLMNRMLDKETQIAAVFVGNDVNGYRYVIGSKFIDTRRIATSLNEKFQGRGGGKPQMVQGTLHGTKTAIKEACIKCSEEV